MIVMVRNWLVKRCTMFMRIAIAVMTVAALVWLGYEFWRLVSQSRPVWHSSPSGAIDLKLRHIEVGRWFSGKPVYSELASAAYPPASYVILWPFVGWLEFTTARWLWACTSVLALVWLVYLVVKESTANTPLERVFVALVPLSMYATGATIGNGQLIVHLLPMLLAGVLMLHRKQPGLYRDIAAVALILLTFVKPNVAALVFWIVAFVPGRPLPAFLLLIGYFVLTILGSLFQPLHELLLLPNVLSGSVEWGAEDRYADIAIWLANLGLVEWIIPVTLFVMLVFGLWTYRHRQSDIWLILGVTALVTRFLTYHRWYDDLLILLPMVSLFRQAKGVMSPDGSNVTAGVLFATTLLAMLAPGGLYLFPSPWNSAYAVCQAILWGIVLVFLLDQTRRDKTRVLAMN